MPMQWLADIPQELRLMIYHETFKDVKVLPLEFTSKLSRAYRHRHAGFALFLANKQVYAESKPIFQKEAIYVFKHNSSFSHSISRSTQIWLVLRKRNDVWHMQKMCCESVALNSIVSEIVFEKQMHSSLEPCALLKEVYVDDVQSFAERAMTVFSRRVGSFKDVGRVLSRLKGVRVYCTMASNWLIWKLIINENHDVVTIIECNSDCTTATEKDGMNEMIAGRLRLGEGVKFVWERLRPLPGRHIAE